jgi:glutaredoxin
MQQEMIEKSGQMGVPVIDIDGKIIVGFNQEKICQLLNINIDRP